MITSFFLYLVFGLVYAVSYPIRGLADVSFPAGVTTAISSVGTYLATANMVISLSDLAIVVGAVLSIEAVIFTYKGIMWVIKRFPTQS